MPDTRIGGASYGAILATLEKLTEAIGLLSRVDDQRAEQIASLEVAQAELRGDLRRLEAHLITARDDALRRFAALLRRVELLEGRR